MNANVHQLANGHDHDFLPFFPPFIFAISKQIPYVILSKNALR